MLAILATHPIQYQVPIWQQLAERGTVPFEVWYLTAHGVKPSLDRQFGTVFSWDMDMLGGYPHLFPPEPVPQQLGGFWEVGLPSDFRDRLNSGRITALLVHGWNVRACWEAVYLAHRAGVKVWMRGDSNDLKLDTGTKRLVKHWLLGSLLRRVDGFLCVGEANRRLYRHYGVGGERLFSGPHCVDNERFAAQSQRYRPDRQALRQAWGIPDNAYCLLFVGKFIHKKHPLDLVVAAHRLATLDSNWSYHLLFVGTGELGSELRQRCRVVHDAESGIVADTADTGTEPSASFAGFLNQTEISRAYVAADALVLPSDPGETWGLVVNEALASGLPCVVSAACGSAEDLVVPLDPPPALSTGRHRSPGGGDPLLGRSSRAGGGDGRTHRPLRLQRHGGYAGNVVAHGDREMMDLAIPGGRNQAEPPEKILVFHTGSLGDTLLVIPSIHILKAHFAPARLTLLCDIQAGSNYVLATDVLTGTGLIDSVITYAVSRGRLGWVINLLRKAMLLLRLRAAGFHTLAYLVEVYRGDHRIERDRWFFKLAGIRRFIGMEGLEQRPVARGFAISRVAHRADELLNRLAAAGVPVPPPGQGSLNLNLQPAEIVAFEQWRLSLPPDGGRPWLGVGPGSKMPAKIWPGDRFQKLVQQLIGQYDIWPVIFGGREDADLGNQLVKAWGRGYVAAGTLGVRPSAVGLSRCLLYVGNDTGTMHLAAAAGIPCMAIFSSREAPGRWDPYGPGHQVLRTVIDCAGCGLMDCVERAKECLMKLSVEDAAGACRMILHQKLPKQQAH